MKMSMSRFRRVTQLWNWLPGFRGVAEHEGVHKAAQTLGVSPSALSRTVKLLESAVGAALFVRDNSRMELTPLGAELLTVTRNMMRQLDDTLAAEEARRGGDGPLRLGVTSDLGAITVARAIATHEYSGSPLHVLHVDEDAALQELLRGNLDLIVGESTPRHPDVTVERVGELAFGIYAAKDHPLGAGAPGATQAIASTFAPALPPEIKVACYCDSIEVARTLCETSALLCALPDLLAHDAPRLQRVGDTRDAVTLCAIRRTPLSPTRDDSRLAELVEQLRATLAR